MHYLRQIILAIACFYGSTVFAADTTVSVLMQKALTDLPGREAVVLTVEYQPGVSSSIHRHNAHTFVYVLDGTITMQVEGGEKVTLGVGETFYEAPEDIHSVSMNASTTETAKFLVFFIKDQGAPATVPVGE